MPGRGADKLDCMARRVQARLSDALVVHRLDMATSGVLVLARGPTAQRCLGAAFERREVHKRYVAVVHGEVDADAGEIDLPLAADWPRRPRQKVDAVAGRPSLTRWRRLSVDAAAGTSRLLLEPVTGRSHQLRVHLLAIGHPIVGDALYGAPEAARLMLHAASLALPHPRTGEPLRIASPVPF